VDSIEQHNKPNKIKPVCDIVEKANNRFTRFWYKAEIVPIIIELTLENKKRLNQNSEKSNNTKKNNLTKTENNTIFGAVEYSMVTDKIEPS
jgi:hypothetical protein